MFGKWSAEMTAVIKQKWNNIKTRSKVPLQKIDEGEKFLLLPEKEVFTTRRNVNTSRRVSHIKTNVVFNI